MAGEALSEPSEGCKKGATVDTARQGVLGYGILASSSTSFGLPRTVPAPVQPAQQDQAAWGLLSLAPCSVSQTLSGQCKTEAAKDAGKGDDRSYERQKASRTGARAAVTVPSLGEEDSGLELLGRQ